MAHVLNPETTESNPLNTELETPTLEAPPEQSEPTAETTSNPETPEAAPHVASEAAQPEPAGEAHDHHEEPDLSMEDFAAALESFDREQAAEAAAQAFDDSAIVTGTVIKLTDKHVVVDVGMKSEGLIPIEQVVDHT